MIAEQAAQTSVHTWVHYAIEIGLGFFVWWYRSSLGEAHKKREELVLQAKDDHERIIHLEGYLQRHSKYLPLQRSSKN